MPMDDDDTDDNAVSLYDRKYEVKNQSQLPDVISMIFNFKRTTKSIHIKP